MLKGEKKMIFFSILNYPVKKNGNTSPCIPVFFVNIVFYYNVIIKLKELFNSVFSTENNCIRVNAFLTSVNGNLI